MRIAIIGSGAAGLGAAWLLSQRFETVIYEAAAKLGGHANTVDVMGPQGPVCVDTGFIVYNELNFIFSDYQWQYALELANSKLSKLF